jgi:hypothetical protein
VRPNPARPEARSPRAGVLAGCGLLLLVLAAAGPAAASTGSGGSLDSVVIPNLGPGYTVSSQGPLNPSQFASNAPDPGAAEAALSTLAKSISTYERVWQSDGGLNQVQDLLVRFPSVVGAQVFLQAAQHSLESGEIVSSDPVASIPGARRVTYFAATDKDGVGEAIAMRAGIYVDLLSVFSAASGNAQPISPANAERVADAQHAAMVAAPGGTATATATGSKKGVSASTIVVAVLAVAVLAAALVTPAVLRRRRAAEEASGPDPTMVALRRRDSSGGDAVDDVGERSG